MFPNQDTTTLAGPRRGRRGPTPLEQWPIRGRLTLALMSRTAAVDIDTLDAWMGVAHEEDQRLRCFAYILTTLLVECDSPAASDRLWRLVESPALQALLDTPILAGLHERLDYVTILTDYLRWWLRGWERATGEMTYAAQHDFVTALETELLRRREAWKARLRARNERRGLTREILTAIVWAPRNMERWLAAAGDDDAARDHLFNGFELDGVGTAVTA